ncbi:MAG: hypothetical protein IJ232_04110 [Lachnospiraceae bacterium]|nr:hypothetical protein [Lachnospiraceae bacterium]
MINKNNKKNLIIISTVICMFVTVLYFLQYSYVVHAATPRVMLEDYRVKEGQVVSGKDFTLDLTLKNYSAKQVKNLKVTIATENGDFIPTGSAGSEYIEFIDAGETSQVSFKMKAGDGLEEKSYKVNVTTDYENPNGYEYRAEESIFLPVSLDQRLSVTDLFVDSSSCVVGDTVEISASINNMGEGALYNVMVEVEGDNIEENKSYVGTIEKSKSGNLDILTKADVVTEGYHKDNKLIVEYENKAGETFTQEVLVDVSVGVPVYENLEKIKEGNDNSVVWKTTAEVIGILLLIVIIGYILYRRQKRKQRILDEFAR